MWKQFQAVIMSMQQELKESRKNLRRASANEFFCQRIQTKAFQVAQQVTDWTTLTLIWTLTMGHKKETLVLRQKKRTLILHLMILYLLHCSQDSARISLPNTGWQVCALFLLLHMNNENSYVIDSQETSECWSTMYLVVKVHYWEGFDDSIEICNNFIWI